MCEENGAGGGLGWGGLPPAELGPPSHCLRSAVHSSSSPLFRSATWHGMAGAGTPRCRAQLCTGLQGEGVRVCSETSQSIRVGSSRAGDAEGLCSWWH